MNKKIRTDLILGSKRFSNYAWSFILMTGGIGFCLTGVGSYFNLNTILFVQFSDINFIPQGIVMLFYGTIAILFSLFLIYSILTDVGGGYNKYDKEKKEIEIFRLGYNKKNKQMLLKYNFRDIKSIKIELKDDINPKREIYLVTKNKNQIPLTRIGEPLLLSDVENQAIELANFLNIPIEGI